MAKVQISIDDKLLEKIDNYADANYMSRSGLITLASNQFLTTYEALEGIKSISASMRRIADNNLVEGDLLKELEHLEYYAKTFCGK